MFPMRLKIHPLAWLNGLSVLSLFGMAIVGVVRRAPVPIALAVLPFGCMMAFSLATHFLPRYASMLVPSMLISLIVLASWGGEMLFKRAVRSTACLNDKLGQDAKKDGLDAKKD